MDRGVARIEAFSDGVFAIAITLLILEIKVPQLPEGAGDGQLWAALARSWPSFVAFLASFVTILIMWVNHHWFFSLVKAVDSVLLFANGLLLLMVTFVPFPAAVLARYFESPARNAAAAFYCGSFVAVSVAFQCCWYAAAYRRRLIRNAVPSSLLRRVGRAYWFGFAVYASSAVLAFWHATAAFLLCNSLWVLWATLRYRWPMEAAAAEASS